jgi:hypothetical protein
VHAAEREQSRVHPEQPQGTGACAVLDTDLVVIRTYPNSIEAELAMSALEAAGIHVLIRRDDGGGMQPALWLSGVKVLVRSEDAAAAADVLGTEIDAKPDEDQG